MSKYSDLQRARSERTARLRARIRTIKPEDADMIALIAVLKGLIDIIDDDEEEGGA